MKLLKEQMWKNPLTKMSEHISKQIIEQVNTPGYWQVKQQVSEPVSRQVFWQVLQQVTLTVENSYKIGNQGESI